MYQALKGSPYIVQILDMVRDPLNESNFGYTMEYLKIQDYRDQYPELKDMDIRYAMYQILLGLDFAHSRGVMHRDIKPLNIAIDPDTFRTTVIDWGLADFYIPGKEYSAKGGTTRYKAPEQLLAYPYLSYPLDMWAAGVSFGMMIFNIIPFYNADGELNILRKINRQLGTASLLETMDKYNITWLYPNTLTFHTPTPWEELIDEKNAKKAVPEAISLLSQMLMYDFNKRITAKEALEHPYFNPIRHRFASQEAV